MNEVKELVEELRSKKSRDNRELLDRSADMIERLAIDLCEKSGCHHKCHDTKDCVVEDEAREVIANSATTTEKQIEEMAQFMAEVAHLECGKKPCEECKWLGRENDKADCIDLLIAEHLYNAGYRKQSEGEWIKKYDKAPRYVCSACNHLYNNKEYKYCPNCGAKMKGGE